ncbi:response regulator [bacterium]|nr:response regulator [bacterium]
MTTMLSTTARPKFLAPRKVLIVDDDPIICEVASGLLGQAGWETAFATTPEQALTSLRNDARGVVLCDVHMPGDSGELLATICSEFPQAQVIMITGDPSMESIRHAMQSGAYDYLLKPIRPDELRRVADLAYDRHNLMIEREALIRQNRDFAEQLKSLLEKRTDQLHDSEMRYRTIFDNAVDAILLVTLKDGVIREINAAGKKLIGTRASHAVGRTLHDVFGAQLDDILKEAQESEKRLWKVSRLVSETSYLESHISSAAISRVQLDDVDFLQIVARDRTDFAELSERAELIETELINEQRLATIGLLASGVAHNINTPLMGIYGLAQVIKMKHPDIQDIDGVIAQVERINGIVRNLMWKSRQEQESAPQDIDLNVLLQEELRFLEADMEFKHNVAKHFHFADHVPPIYGRYADFSQSLMNVIRNALDAMHECEAKSLTVRTDFDGSDVLIEITDTGAGIPPEHTPRIFDPFYTTKPPVGKSQNGEPTGTGLGLSTVQKLLAPYDCKFDVESEVGKGTCFRIYVPYKPQSEIESAVEDESAMT